MIGGPCYRCVDADPVGVEGLGGHWCRFNHRPAYGNGCYWFRCRERCPMPNGNGTLCRKTGDVLPAGPCRVDCERRRTR